MAEPDPNSPQPPPSLLPAPAGQRRFNAIYEKLVREPGDLVGMIAYALYKNSKRDWIRRFEQEEGRRPDLDDTFYGYVRAQGEGELARLRNQAEDLVAEYAGVVVKETTPEIVQKALETDALVKAADLHRSIERNTRWWKGIGANVAGAFVYSLLLILAVIVLRWADVDVLGLLEKARPNR